MFHTLIRLAARLGAPALIAGTLLVAMPAPAHAVPHTDWPAADIHPITFPVQGPTNYSDVFGDPRSIGTELGMGRSFLCALGAIRRHSEPASPDAARPRQWPRSRRTAAKQCDERAAHHSITSSASASSLSGIWRPSAFAAFRLITSSNLVGCHAETCNDELDLVRA